MPYNDDYHKTTCHRSLANGLALLLTQYSPITLTYHHDKWTTATELIEDHRGIISSLQRVDADSIQKILVYSEDDNRDKFNSIKQVLQQSYYLPPQSTMQLSTGPRPSRGSKKPQVLHKQQTTNKGARVHYVITDALLTAKMYARQQVDLGPGDKIVMNDTQCMEQEFWHQPLREQVEKWENSGYITVGHIPVDCVWLWDEKWRSIFSEVKRWGRYLSNTSVIHERGWLLPLIQFNPTEVSHKVQLFANLVLQSIPSLQQSAQHLVHTMENIVADTENLFPHTSSCLSTVTQLDDLVGALIACTNTFSPPNVCHRCGTVCEMHALFCTNAGCSAAMFQLCRTCSTPHIGQTATTCSKCGQHMARPCPSCEYVSHFHNREDTQPTLTRLHTVCPTCSRSIVPCPNDCRCSHHVAADLANCSECTLPIATCEKTLYVAEKVIDSMDRDRGNLDMPWRYIFNQWQWQRNKKGGKGKKRRTTQATKRDREIEEDRF